MDLQHGKLISTSGFDFYIIWYMSYNEEYLVIIVNQMLELNSAKMKSPETYKMAYG